MPANFRETQCSKVHKCRSATEVLEWGSYCDENPQRRQQVKLYFRIKVYLLHGRQCIIYSLHGAVLCAGCWQTRREGQCSGGRTTPAPWPPTAACRITVTISLNIIKMERSVQHDPYRGFINVLTSGTPGICVHERRSVCFINVQNVQLYIMLCYSDS